MARFMIKASEYKNVCKAVNDRKLAELKKEIIEILKKQDEKEVKKAIDYFNSQELHYTHLEKSLVSGKWIEKAGYGVGTVRIWKGKKYKKIAPGKWARVFDKEGRGTNIAIGKLIARVNKIDNAEDLLQFVMENKQRFVDEDGKELGILDKVRAAVDTRNEKLSGESSPYVYGVGENVNRAKNEMFSKKDKIKKEEADLHKVSRKLSQIPTTELKQEKARLERAVENKTRSKRDSLNNVIFRESNQEKLDAINKELEKRNPVKAEKIVEDKIKENPDYPFKPKTDKERAERAAFEKDRDDFIERMDKIRQENAENNFTENDIQKLKKKGYSLENLRKKGWSDEEIKEELLKDKKQLNKEEIRSQVESGYENKSQEELENDLEYLKKQIKSDDSMTVSLVGSEKMPIKDAIEILKDIKKNNNKKVALKGTSKPAEKKSPEKLLKEMGFETMEKVSFNGDKWEVAGVTLDYNGNANGISLTPDRQAGNLHSSNVTVFDIDKIQKNKPAEKKEDENKTYWIQDSRGNRLTNEDAKSRIIDNNMQIFKLNGSNESRKDMKIRELKNENEYLMDRLNPEDKAEVEIPDYASKLNSDESRKLTEELERLQEGGESETNIIMPMVGSHEKMDYSAGRSEKAAEKEKKAAELKRNKEYNQELCKVFESKYGYDLVENMASHIDERLPDFSNEDLQREYNRLGLNYDKLMEKKAISINSVVDKKSNMDLKKVYLYQKVMEKHPEVKDKIIAELEKRGISVKKSLFDDFIVDVFEADDEDELEHELYEGETEYNDYSAEQPELFNSTSMKVREALDRIRNQVL